MKHLYKCTVLCGRTMTIVTRRGQTDPANCIGECVCGGGLMIKVPYDNIDRNIERNKKEYNDGR